MAAVAMAGHGKEGRRGHVFVTVGSTQFDDLIRAVGAPSFVALLRRNGFTRLVIQYGRGTARPEAASVDGFTIEAYDYKPSLAPDMAAAAVVVSHAGAGTCLEALEAGKPLLVVVNEKLADNHQVELAAKLKEEGYLEYTTPANVEEAFGTVLAEGRLKPYKMGNAAPFARWLGRLTGAAPIQTGSR